MQNIQLSSQCECGNAINFTHDKNNEVSFELRPDTNSDDRQWFLFKVSGAKSKTLTLKLLNTGDCNIPVLWDHALPVYSNDGQNWQHVTGPTAHCDGVFSFTHQFTEDEVTIAMHYPYGLSEMKTRLDRWSKSQACVLRESIGNSVEGRPIELLRFTNPDGLPSEERKGVWIIARQHAGETSANYTLDGLVEFLLSDHPQAVELLKSSIINIVPMVNPDGVVAGNYRDNIKGVNLNRVWNSYDEATSPEVLHVSRAIDKWVEDGHSYDLFLDFHSDSEGWGHYCFYAEKGVGPTNYDGDYYEETMGILHRIGELAEDFDPNEGASTNREHNLARGDQMFRHGVMSLIFEAGYSKVLFGKHQGHYLTVDRHQRVGHAAGIAISEYLFR